MKKYCFLFIAFVFHFSLLDAQNWTSLGIGINGEINTMAEYNSILWIGGTFDSAGGAPSRNIVQWNNASWIPMGNGFNWGTTSMAVYNGDLYIGGEYDSVARKPIDLLARWNGSQWDSVGVLGLSGYDVYALDTLKGKLYAAGWFGAADGFIVKNIASWNGIKWDSLENGIGTARYGTPTCMCVYNGVLYIGGGFDTVNRMRDWNFVGWNGTNWITFDTIVNDIIQCMTVYKGELYIGGYFNRAGGVPVHSIAKWNGIIWADVGGGIEFNPGTANFRAYSLKVYNGDLYVGGTFDTAGGMPVHYIAKWDGSNWYNVDFGVTGGIFPGIYSMSVYDSSLYIGGVFDTAGSLPANNIAKWTTPPSDIQEICNNNFCKIYPNPTTGIFTISFTGAQNPDSYRDVPATIEIYNVLGEEVYSNSYQPLANSHQLKTIDLSSQPNGVYFYRVVKESGELIGEGKVLMEK